MYDPVIGRWISEDPLGFLAGDTNLARYVGNSPTNATDPSGLRIYDATNRPSGKVFKDAIIGDRYYTGADDQKAAAYDMIKSLRFLFKHKKFYKIVRHYITHDEPGDKHATLQFAEDVAKKMREKGDKIFIYLGHGYAEPGGKVSKKDVDDFKMIISRLDAGKNDALIGFNGCFSKFYNEAIPKKYRFTNHFTTEGSQNLSDSIKEWNSTFPKMYKECQKLFEKKGRDAPIEIHIYFGMYEPGDGIAGNEIRRLRETIKDKMQNRRFHFPWPRILDKELKLK